QYLDKDNNTIWNQFLDQISKAKLLQPVEPSGFLTGFEMSGDVHLLWPPFSKLVSATFIIRPPSPRNTINDKLSVHYRFITRSCVTIQFFRQESQCQDEISVKVTMDPTNEYSVSETKKPFPRRY